jgi:predicted nucleic acid-binding protein
VSVLDASLALDLVLGRPRGRQWRDWATTARFVAPDHVVAECGRTLRRAVLQERLTPERGRTALDAVLRLPIVFYRTSLFARGAWDLRPNFAFDDALYVVMAQRLGEDLASTDERLVAATRQFTTVPLATPVG